MKRRGGLVDTECERVFLLFEGVCPQCHSPVHAIGIGGTEQMLLENNAYFVEAQQHGGRTTVWGSTIGGGQDCYIEMRCNTCNCSFGLSHSHGEWLSS